MRRWLKTEVVLILMITGFAGIKSGAQTVDLTGISLFRAVTTNLNGSGIRVAQPEAYNNGTTNWEVDPNYWSVQQPVSRFTYFSSAGTSSSFPNSLNAASQHAGDVAGTFYGMNGNLATNVAHVDNYDADYFAQVSSMITPFTTNYIVSLPSTNISDQVVNQSFAWIGADVTLQQALDQAYDNYAAQYNTLFVSGSGYDSAVSPLATCYNGIGVNAYGLGVHAGNGPTMDNGRSKPDITAPSASTSGSAPQVAGAAAVLIQAGLRGDGGSDTNSAADIRTLKALLLNGAVKPAGWTNLVWTNGARLVLDTNIGAGVLNLLNSYELLAGGKHGCNFATNVPSNTAHPPVRMTNFIGALSGWDFNTNTSANGYDGVNHYFFNVSNNVAGAKFTATATLVWNRHPNQSAINNLNLFLYNAANSNLVASSTSRVDNVEHIFVPALAQGRYDLQVWKTNGTSISAGEPYALAWEFFSVTARAVRSGTNVAVVWPVYPAGFWVEGVTNLVSTNWIPLTNYPSIVTNNQNQLPLGPTNKYLFFRLRRPNL